MTFFFCWRRARLPRPRPRPRRSPRQSPRQRLAARALAAVILDVAVAAAAEAAELLAILEEVRRLRRRSISIHRSEDWFCRNRSRIGPSSLGGRAARAPERPSLGCRCERRCVRAPAMWMYARVYCTCYIKWTTKFTPCSKRSTARSSCQHPRGSARQSMYKALRDQHPARGVLAYLRAARLSAGSRGFAPFARPIGKQPSARSWGRAWGGLTFMEAVLYREALSCRACMNNALYFPFMTPMIP